MQMRARVVRNHGDGNGADLSLYVVLGGYEIERHGDMVRDNSGGGGVSRGFRPGAWRDEDALALYRGFTTPMLYSLRATYRQERDAGEDVAFNDRRIAMVDEVLRERGEQTEEE